jgi:hypothetical protein
MTFTGRDREAARSRRCRHEYHNPDLASQKAQPAVATSEITVHETAPW